MALHLIKLAVGVDDLPHMKKLQAARRKQRRQSPRSPHWVYTRNTPRRAKELLDGGSLYWVVRGVIRCRQELVGFEEDIDDEDGKKRNGSYWTAHRFLGKLLAPEEVGRRAAERTVRKSAARCGTRRKPKQKQPTNRSAPCAFLSRHRPVVLPASNLCALLDTLKCDTLRKPLRAVIAVLRRSCAPRTGRSIAARWRKHRAPWSRLRCHP